jgi:hypothetical protein
MTLNDRLLRRNGPREEFFRVAQLSHYGRVIKLHELAKSLLSGYVKSSLTRLCHTVARARHDLHVSIGVHDERRLRILDLFSGPPAHWLAAPNPAYCGLDARGGRRG